MHRLFCVLGLLSLLASSGVQAADEIVKLPIFGVSVNKTELVTLGKMKIGDAIEAIKKKNIQVIVVDILIDPRLEKNPDLKTDSVKEAQYFLRSNWHSGLGSAQATYVAAEEDGMFRFLQNGKIDRGPRPLRSEPLIVLTASCDVNDLLHEYMHHLIAVGSDSTLTYEGKKIPRREYSRILKEQAKETVAACVAKQKEALKQEDGGAYATAENEKVWAICRSLPLQVLTDTMSAKEEMEITRFFVEHSKDFNFDNREISFNLGYYQTAVTKSLDRTEALITSFQKLIDEPLTQQSLSSETKKALLRTAEALNLSHETQIREGEWFNQYLQANPVFHRKE